MYARVGSLDELAFCVLPEFGARIRRLIANWTCVATGSSPSCGRTIGILKFGSNVQVLLVT